MVCGKLGHLEGSLWCPLVATTDASSLQGRLRYGVGEGLTPIYPDVEMGADRVTSANHEQSY